MSELTDSVRKMLSQAQVFARDTPFEAVSRARQASQLVKAALASCSESERAELSGLAQLAESRAAKYEARLEAWLEESRGRAEVFHERERLRIERPLRAKV